jgi:hypothetical protein
MHEQRQKHTFTRLSISYNIFDKGVHTIRSSSVSSIAVVDFLSP